MELLQKVRAKLDAANAARPPHSKLTLSIAGSWAYESHNVTCGPYLPPPTAFCLSLSLCVCARACASACLRVCVSASASVLCVCVLFIFASLEQVWHNVHAGVRGQSGGHVHSDELPQQ